MKTTEEQDQEYLEEQREQLRKDVEAHISKHVQGKDAVDCNVDPPDVHWKINDLQVKLGLLTACVDRLGRRQTELEQWLRRVDEGKR